MARNIISDSFVQKPDEIALGKGDQLNPFSVVALRDVVNQIADRMNGGVTFGNGSTASQAGNVDAVYATAITPGVANTEFTLKHELGRIPIGFHTTMNTTPGSVYASRPQSWTATQVYLKCSAASANITVMLF